VRADTTAVSGSEQLTPVQIRQMLDQLGSWTEVTRATDASAKEALRLGPDLLAHLRNAEDSVEAQLRLAEAHLVLDEPTLACRLLLAIEARAQRTRFRQSVGVLVGDPTLNCRNR
jgi:hypothetical protein